MPLEPRDPTVRVPPTKGRQGCHDNGAHQSARPATEDLRQGEGRTVLALLGALRPRVQAGDAPHGVRGSEGEQRGPGHRRGHVRRYRGRRRGGVPPAAPGRTGLPHGLGPCGVGGRRSRRTAAARSDSSRSLPSATAWSRARSSSSWSPSSRPTSNRGRMGTGRRGQRIKRWTGWRKRSCRARPASSIWISAPTSIACGMTCCSRRWPGGSTIRRAGLAQADAESLREDGRSPGWGDLARAQQPLPHRGGPDAGAGQGGHPVRQVHGAGVRAVCR